MLRITDQTGQTIDIEQPPQRIITCVPSQTELLFDLGLENSVIGITKFCVHPPKALQTKTKVGGTKNLHLEKIAALNPDFILANKEENNRESIEWLANRFPAYISDIRTLEQAYSMIQDVGVICDCRQEATALVESIADRFAHIRAADLKATAVYLIWQKPYMTINADTFIHDMLVRLGFDNAFAHRTDSRYPEVTLEDIIWANPRFIFLSSEPFPFQSSHVATLKELFPQAHVTLVDGEMFSWYGSRLHHFNCDFAADMLAIANGL